MKRLHKLLLVDDEIGRKHVDYMKFYVWALEKAGYDVATASSFESALEVVQRHYTSFSLIIADLMMPQGLSLSLEETEGGLRTGVFLCDRLKEIAPKVPILILTQQHDQTILNMLQKRSNVLKIINKLDCTPYELSKIVAEIVEE